MGNATQQEPPGHKQTSLFHQVRLQEDRTQLQAIVNQIIHDAQQDPNLHNMVATVTPEIIMAKPIQQL